MWSLGHGYGGIEQLITLTNIAKSLTVKNGNKTMLKIVDVVKTVAEKIMNDTAK